MHGTRYRHTCDKVAPLQKREAFDMYFKKGHRKTSENVTDYIARRFNEYEKLTELSTETAISDDLRAYFLLDMSGVDDQKHKRNDHFQGGEFSHHRKML